MPKQLSLFSSELDTGSYSLHGIFFAIFLDAFARKCIAPQVGLLCSEHGLKGRPLPANRLHVSLYAPGNHAYSLQAIVAIASEAAASIRMPPFEVRFDRVLSFSGRPNNRPLVLLGTDGVAALMTFQQVLSTTMRRVGLGDGQANQRFNPHVTLLYDSRGVAEQAVEPICWTVREFYLVDSLVGQSRYVLRGRWPLRG